MLANLLNKPGGRVSKGQQQEVLELIRSNDRSITVVDCGKDVDDDFIAELCHALMENRFVTALRIRDKQMSPAMFPLAQLCKKTTTLVSIKVSYANLSDEDAQVLFLALLKNVSIQSLSLDHNRISSSEAIVKLLTFNRNIDSLDLSYNNLGARGDEPLQQIAEALCVNRNLKQLYLSGNGMSDSCARRFVQVIDENIHLMQLRVLDIAAENSVRPETKQALKLILEAARQTAAASSRRSVEEGADDMRIQLANLGFAPPSAPRSRVDEREPQPALGMDDVTAWQEQVDAANGRFDDERRELQSVIERLKSEKEQLANGQIAALEQTNKLQQQVALMTERSLGLQRDLDHLTAKHDKKIRESSDQIAALQSQVMAIRQELVRSQEVAATDRSNLVQMQESLTQELSQLHTQLAAANKADDLLNLCNHSVSATRAILVNAGTMTEELAPKAENRQPNDEVEEWSESTDAVATNHARTSGLSIPSPLPRSQWLDDDSTENCRMCRLPFTLTRRRHHCRLCGHVFCGRCAPEHKQWKLRACLICVSCNS